MTDTVEAGFAVADITPPVGTPMSCYPRVRKDLSWAPDAMKGYVGRQDVSQGIHDPLLATAFALRSGDSRCVMIGLDTGMITAEFTTRIRNALVDHGVPATNVLVGASHTHSGPDLFAWWEGDPRAKLDEHTAALTIDAARRALAHAEAADVSWGVGHLDYVSINRRDEKGPTDPTVSVLKATSRETGAVLGLVVNFACHPVTLDYRNVQFSADYVYFLRRTVAQVYAGAGCVFLNGAAGNINPARFPYDQRANIYIPQTLENYPVYWGGFPDAERMGRTLGAEAVQAAERALPLDVTRISGISLPVHLNLKQHDELTEFLDFMNFRSEEYRRKLLEAQSLKSEVQLLSLGELSIVGLPGEPFVEIGLAVKQAQTRHRPVMIAGYANDDVRYVLTDDAYVAGQYETVGTPLAAGSAQRLVDAGLELLAPGVGTDHSPR